MSADLRCTGTPVSWLRLERFHAGELGAAEQDAIAAHLEACPTCAACLARIVTDDETALPALPTARNVSFLRRAAPIVTALAVAAAVVLFLRRPPPPEARPGPHDGVKGGDVMLVLVRDDATVLEDGGVYQEGDRVKAMVTCPPALRAAWDLVVFDRGQPSFPLEPQAELACGNAVPLPGAFRISGAAPLDVCLVWSTTGPVDRRAVAALDPPSMSCLLLRPAP